MSNSSRFDISQIALLVSIFTLTSVSVITIRFLAPSIFNAHVIYISISLLLLYLFTKVDFDIYSAFSTHLYVMSIMLLLLTLFIGQVTRGAVRWIPIGSLTFQPSEIVRPLLLLFFANYTLTNKLDFKRLLKLLILVLIPLILILLQPSLGVTILTFIGFVGILFASGLPKKYFITGLLIIAAILPLIWIALAPYQKQRVLTFLEPEADPRGSGYNSIQSMIAVGSGKIFGRGLGKGAQTQLAFLPERQTDFIFAAISEELGFLGASVVLIAQIIVFVSLIKIVGSSKNPVGRAYVSGVVVILFSQAFIHIGMNMGLLPITGIPLPFVSAGGSALLANFISIAIALKARA